MEKENKVIKLVNILKENSKEINERKVFYLVKMGNKYKFMMRCEFRFFKEDMPKYIVIQR